MSTQSMKAGKELIILNYFSLAAMNVCFAFAYKQRGASHLVDAAGLGALFIVIFSFIQIHMRSGLWKLTHLPSEKLDERELQITHKSLSKAYGGFTVTSLSIMMAHAVLYSLVPTLNFVITMPLVVSLIYLAHTLPGSILAWNENMVSGDPS